MPPSSPWTSRSLPSSTLHLHRPHPPLSLRTRTRLRFVVFVLAFLLTASTLYEVCFRQRGGVVEEEWKYRVGEQLKMGVERMRVKGVSVDGKESEGKEKGGEEGETKGGDGDGTLVDVSGGMDMYREGIGGGNGRWIDEVGEGRDGDGEEVEEESRMGMLPSSTVVMEGAATSEVVGEGQRTLVAMQYEEEFKSKVDAEVPVGTIAPHAAESGLVDRPIELEPVTIGLADLPMEAPVTASNPPVQTPAKLRSEPMAYTLSFSLL